MTFEQRLVEGERVGHLGISGEEDSRQRGQAVPRPCGRNLAGVLEDWQGIQCGWGRGRGITRGDKSKGDTFGWAF